MNERQVEMALRTFFSELEWTDPDDWGPGEQAFMEDLGADIEGVQTYREAGLLTQDAGLVLTLAGGAQFQVTIKQSREGGAL